MVNAMPARNCTIYDYIIIYYYYIIIIIIYMSRPVRITSKATTHFPKSKTKSTTK